MRIRMKQEGHVAFPEKRQQRPFSSRWLTMKPLFSKSVLGEREEEAKVLRVRAAAAAWKEKFLFEKKSAWAMPPPQAWVHVTQPTNKRKWQVPRIIFLFPLALNVFLSSRILYLHSKVCWRIFDLLQLVRFRYDGVIPRWCLYYTFHNIISMILTCLMV